MKRPAGNQLFFLSLMLLGSVFAAISTEGGNITSSNLSQIGPSSWHAVVGQVTGGTFVPFSIAANPGAVSLLDVPAGFNSCKNGVKSLHLLFSNSPLAISTLRGGNISTLDAFISSGSDSAAETLVNLTSFNTGYGTIANVPTGYTISVVPGTFRTGYANDQPGNFVFLTEVVMDELGFNGSPVDYQILLPTNNGSPVTYYAHADLICNPQSNGTVPYSPGGGGPPINQTNYNLSNNQSQNQTNATTNGTDPCAVPEIYCEDFGPCIDGFRTQRCFDVLGCLGVETYNIERCPDLVNITMPFDFSQPYSKYVLIIREPAINWLLVFFVSAGISALILLLWRWRRRRGWNS